MRASAAAPRQPFMTTKQWRPERHRWLIETALLKRFSPTGRANCALGTCPHRQRRPRSHIPSPAASRNAQHLSSPLATHSPADLIRLGFRGPGCYCKSMGGAASPHRPVPILPSRRGYLIENGNGQPVKESTLIGEAKRR